ncbi:hypothetical protein PHLGIDRAFT_19574 [Phlebiopsis gigantea 11061_1 CR5-6]|uniref:DUF6593 domain-containing protein n=1 Tax=Phlebiopsis gigantea (strain 11061_1 CR5-6) TaxID=745531 RepID=A0A0C3S623_PHLG1|nr:hypothetical protein PHLGIDRAFT_19574 [Phlebiopsis gigantea 11061_1 CR5-6]
MIILESEWDEAAGVVEQSEGNGEISAPQSVATGYVQSAEEPRSRAAQSVTSRTSRSSDPVPPSPLVAESIATTSYGSTTSDYPDSANPNVMGPVSYTFAPVLHSPNSMNLQSQVAMVPVYHISVRMNVFIPSSYITIVTRGDNVRGEMVGQFEMGFSIKKATVIMDGKEKLIENVLVKGGTRMARTWQWKFESDSSRHISWTFDDPVKYCYVGTRSVGSAANVLAAFTPPPLTPRSDGRVAPAATLKVFPLGQYLFDHILLSALILERRRLSAS